MDKMFVLVLVIASLVCQAAAETMPCTQGREACSDSHWKTARNGTVYCCMDEFSMDWSVHENNDNEEVCMCIRRFYQHDCYDDAYNCSSNTSIVLEGLCCKLGEGMAHVFNTDSNGEVINSACKCRRFVAPNGTVIGK